MPGSIEHHSTIVIGSGFGGAVAASTLTEAGESVLLLERGPWRDTDPVRKAGIPHRRPLPAGRHLWRVNGRETTLQCFTRVAALCYQRGAHGFLALSQKSANKNTFAMVQEMP